MSDLGRRILIISNGHGEDLIGASLAKSLRAHDQDLALRALAVVGLGQTYAAAGVPLLMAGRALPSGGFIRNGLRNLMADLGAGLLSLTWRQRKALRRAAEETDLAVCVGDCLLLLLAGPVLHCPLVFLPTAKSDYVSPHWPVEIRLMRRYCARIFPRDAVTARSLAAHGLPAEFLGNIMMDALEETGPDLSAQEGQWVIGILPGSRQEAYLNMEDIARVTLALHALAPERTPAISYLVALAGMLSPDEVARRLGPHGWVSRAADADQVRRGIVGHLEHRASCPPVRLTLVKGRFADVLAASHAVIGMAGTANEQAAGLGKPVITFVGRGAQFTEKFVRTQKKLLGAAISVVERDPHAVAREILAIIPDKARKEAMAREGRERMGGAGGADRTARAIIRMLTDA
ncbi:MAG: lipid-A-disaccharide synthase-related protein [Bacteroidota bacterium]